MFWLGLRHCMQSGRTLILRRSHLMLQKCTIMLKTSICRKWMALNEEEVRPVGKWWVSLYYGQVIFPMACTILSIYHSTSIWFSAVCTDTVSCLSSTREWIRARNSLLAGRAWEKWISLNLLPSFLSEPTLPIATQYTLGSMNEWMECWKVFHTSLSLTHYAEAETPILWPPDAKNWLIGKDTDAGKDRRREEKGTTEDEMVGWHYRLHGHEFA